MVDDPRNNIVPFRRDAGFYLRRARAREQEGACAAAASLYRQALELDPTDCAARVELGVLYAGMGCTELSTRQLCEALWRGAEDDPQLYFVLACNYVEDHLYDAALACFAEMIRCRGEREFEIDRDLSEVFAEIIDGAERLDDRSRSEIARCCAEAMEDLENDDKKNAIAKFERAWSLDPQSPEQASNLAMACYCDGQYARARSVCLRALAIDRGSLQIRCILALIAYEQKDTEELKRQVRFLTGSQPEFLSEAVKIAATLCDVHCYQAALDFLAARLEQQPFCIRLLSSAGVCAHNLAQFQAAAEYFDRAAQIDPKDPILRCLAAQNEAEQKGEKPFRAMVSGVAELPLEKVIEYSRALHDAQDLEGEELRRYPEIGELLRWALTRRDARRLAGLALLARAWPERAEVELRTLLCDCSTAEEDREVYLALLASLGCKGPFMALLEHGIAHITVNVLGGLEALSEEYRSVPEVFIKRSAEQGAPESQLKNGMEIWRKFVAAVVEKGEPAKKLNVPAYAAALSYLSGQQEGGHHTLSQSRAAREYGVSLWHFKKALAHLKSVCQQEDAP